MKKSKLYSANLVNNKLIRIFDAETGSPVTFVDTIDEVSGPIIIVGDRLTITVRSTSGKVKLKIYKLPSGSVLKTIVY